MMMMMMIFFLSFFLYHQEHSQTRGGKCRPVTKSAIISRRNADARLCRFDRLIKQKAHTPQVQETLKKKGFKVFSPLCLSSFCYYKTEAAMLRCRSWKIAVSPKQEFMFPDPWSMPPGIRTYRSQTFRPPDGSPPGPFVPGLFDPGPLAPGTFTPAEFAPRRFAPTPIYCVLT